MKKRYLKYLIIKRNSNEDEIYEYREQERENAILNVLEKYIAPVFAFLTPVFIYVDYCYEKGFTGYLNVSSDHIEINLNRFMQIFFAVCLFVCALGTIIYFIRCMVKKSKKKSYLIVVKCIMVIDKILLHFFMVILIYLLLKDRVPLYLRKKIALLLNVRVLLVLIAIIDILFAGIIYFYNKLKKDERDEKNVVDYLSFYIYFFVITLFVFFVICGCSLFLYQNLIFKLISNWKLLFKLIIILLWLSIVFSILLSILIIFFIGEVEKKHNLNVNKSGFQCLKEFKKSWIGVFLILLGVFFTIMIISIVCQKFGEINAKWYFPDRYVVYQSEDNKNPQIIGRVDKYLFNNGEKKYYAFYVVYENKDYLFLKPIECGEKCITNFIDSNPDKTTTYVVNKSKVDVVYTFIDPKNVTKSLKNDGFTIPN